MIEALLRGKLSREQENMEDVLTSNVFGMLQYVAPELGLFPFLARAVPCVFPSRVHQLTAIRA